MDRRSFLYATVVAPSLAVIVAACGDPAASSSATVPGPPSTTPLPSTPPSTAGSTGAIAFASGPDDVVVRISQEGGFAPVGALFGRVPDLLVTGDGRVFRPGVQTMIFPGPLLPAISVGSITPIGIDRLLAVAQTNGLLTDPPPEYAGNPQVADVTTTVVDLQTDAGPFHHAAYGLGFVPDGQGDPAKELTPARGQLLTFVNAAQDLTGTVGADQLGVDQVFQPTAYRIQARVTDPASTPVDTDGPQPVVVPWPVDAGVRLADASTCAVGSGAALSAALTAANTLTFFTEDGVTYQVSAVGQLPGDTC